MVSCWFLKVWVSKVIGWCRQSKGIHGDEDGADSTMQLFMRWMSKCPKTHNDAQVCWKSRLSTAFRTGLGCFLYGLLLYLIDDTMHKPWLAFPIFGYVIVVRVVGESTVGKALLESSAMATGAAQGMSMAMLVLKFFPPAKHFSNIIITAGCIFTSSFIIALPKSINIFHKRIALAHTGIIYITALVQREHMEVLFPLKLFATTIFAATCGMLALLLPIPRLAFFQVQSQTEKSLQVTCERLKALVDGFCADHTVQALALTLKAKSLGNVANTLHTEINLLKDDLKRETRLFPCHTTSQRLQDVSNGIASLQKLLQGMELALQANVASKKVQGHIMHESLVYATEWVSLALGKLNGSFLPHVNIVLKEEQKVLSSFDKVLTAFHRKVGYPDAANIGSFCEAPESCKDYDVNHHSIYCNEDMPQQSHLNHCDSETVGTMAKTVEGPFECGIVIDDLDKDASIPLSKSLPAMPEHNKARTLVSFKEQAATALFLFNMRKLVVEMGHITKSWNHSPKTTKRSPVFPLEILEAPTNHVPHDHQIQLAPHFQAPTTNINNLLPTRQLTPQLQRQSSIQNAALQAQLSFTSLCGQCTSGETNQNKQTFRQRCLDDCFFEPDLRQLKSVFRLSFTMAIGGTLGFLFNNQRGYWADITVAMGFRALQKGDVFKIASLRTLGISCGSIYGLLMAMELKALLQGAAFKVASLQTLGISNGSIYNLLVALSMINLAALRVIALIPWVILTSFLRKSTIFAYGGGLSSFTAAIVILQSKANKDYTDQDFTLIRIVEALLGMASFVLVEILVFPDRAGPQVKPAMIAGTRKLQNFVSGFLEAYADEHCDVCRTTDIKSKQQELKRGISRQSELVKEAAEEPQFWFVPFRAKLFSRAVEEQKRIFEMLHICVEGLEEIKQVAGGKIDMDKLFLQGELKAAMSIVLEKRVAPTLEFLADTLAYSEKEDQILTALLETPSDEGCMDAFERGAVETVLVMAVCHNPADSSEHAEIGFEELSSNEDTASNSVFLSLGTIAFAIKGLLRHTTQLQEVALEILEAESPKLQHKKV